MVEGCYPSDDPEKMPKKRKKLSGDSRTDIKNIMSGIFERAIAWQLWPKEKGNPIEGVLIHDKKPVYLHREWNEEETTALLEDLPKDVRILVMTGLQSTMRISGLLGAREKHLVLFNDGCSIISVEECYYRGDIDVPKTEASKRNTILGPWLTGQLQELLTGDPERHLFHIHTRPMWGTEEALCRDHRSIHRYFLKPAAQRLGLYQLGFGFHELRREAITRWEERAPLAQATKLAGHTKPRMTTKYVKQEMRKLTPFVTKIEQQYLSGKVVAAATVE